MKEISLRWAGNLHLPQAEDLFVRTSLCEDLSSRTSKLSHAACTRARNDRKPHTGTSRNRVGRRGKRRSRWASRPLAVACDRCSNNYLDRSTTQAHRHAPDVELYSSTALQSALQLYSQLYSALHSTYILYTLPCLVRPFDVHVLLIRLTPVTKRTTHQATA